MRTLALTLCLLALPALAAAENRALVLGNATYRAAAAVPGAADVPRVRSALAAAGFRVISGADVSAATARLRLSEFMAGRADAERLVILLAGHFARSATGSWFLGTDADAPDLALADGMGIPLATVLEIAGAAPGGAVVLLGSEPRRLPLGEGLSPGIGALAIPQGVTVIRGSAREVADFAARDLPRRGVPLATLVAGRPGLVAEGFLSPLVPFLPPGPPQAAPDPGLEERALFEAARTLGTIDALEAYLRRYPDGRFAAEARAEIERIRTEPLRAAEASEQALGLSRDQRREIQRHLLLLGFDPRGIDGIFGPGTRGAIRAWQQAAGLPATGFLDRPQLDRLADEARRRAAELEEEARQRQLEEERRDRAFWQETGARGTEDGLRAYLQRYPDGLFADVARARLAQIEEDRRRAAAERDRAAWDTARAADTIAAYRAYLRDFPQGAFVAEARARIAELEGDAAVADVVERARQAEQALGLTPFTRSLIEQRLELLGFQPGRVDGVFDEATRRALRRFQRSRGLEVSGYVTQATLVRLLAEAMRGEGGN